jgi:small subunit ribosomal protein S6
MNIGPEVLTYRIRKNCKAHMMPFNVDALPARLTRSERQERLNEDGRYLTIQRLKRTRKAPSAMMPNSDRDRDERGGRGERPAARRRRR